LPFITIARVSPVGLGMLAIAVQVFAAGSNLKDCAASTRVAATISEPPPV
jgi:hypothetical protein